MIEVRLFATFREGREKILFFPAAEHGTVSSLTHSLAIKDTEVAICLINGFHASVDAPVKAGDIISLFPPVGGG